MSNINILSDKINVHFRHPIPSVLYSKQIFTVGQMVNLPDTELKSIRNFGKASLQKVNEFRNLVENANLLFAYHNL